MRPVSQQFLDTLRGSHSMVVQAIVVSTFQRGVDPDGVEISVNEQGSSRVTLDGTADIRGSLDMTTDGASRWPRRAGDLLAPYGNEVYVRRGLLYGDGSKEWCPLGYYRIQTPTQDLPPNGPIRLSAKDRMQGIVDARLLAPVQFASTLTYGQVVAQLVNEVYPSAVIDWDDATETETIGRSLITEEKRFEFLNDLVASRGKIWYWDHRGDLVITDPPDVTMPVWDVNAGENGVLVSMSRQLTRERVYNAVVATGEATDTETPVRAIAIDDNPDSPTYFYGAFGPVPRFYSSPFLLTESQCTSAAQAILRQQLGLPYNVDFSAVPNPALEPYDPVRINYSPAVGSEVHVLETVTVPLAEQDPLDATTREQTTVLIGALA